MPQTLTKVCHLPGDVVRMLCRSRVGHGSAFLIRSRVSAGHTLRSKGEEPPQSGYSWEALEDMTSRLQMGVCHLGNNFLRIFH